MSHKWVIPTDAEYGKIKAQRGGPEIAFYRKCERCGCLRRIDGIRNSRMYIPKDGKWSNATAQAPKCVEARAALKAARGEE